MPAIGVSAALHADAEDSGGVSRAVRAGVDNSARPRRVDKPREGVELQRWLWHRAYAMERDNRVVCGARRRRDGQPCQALSVPGKRRCKWHGGCSTGPRTVEGRARVAANFHKSHIARDYARARMTSAACQRGQPPAD